MMVSSVSAIMEASMYVSERHVTGLEKINAICRGEKSFPGHVTILAFAFLSKNSPVS